MNRVANNVGTSFLARHPNNSFEPTEHAGSSLAFSTSLSDAINRTDALVLCDLLGLLSQLGSNIRYRVFKDQNSGVSDYGYTSKADRWTHRTGYGGAGPTELIACFVGLLNHSLCVCLAETQFQVSSTQYVLLASVLIVLIPEEV